MLNTPLPLYEIIFYGFSALMIAAALMVILSKNPVRSVLSLVLCFFSASVLWLMLKAEFLSLLLLFVYVGAVMTLFLFVVMMLNINAETKRTGRAFYWPITLIVLAILLGIILVALGPERLHWVNNIAAPIVETSNTKALGILLFNDYAYPFELAGVLLLVAIVAAISLGFHGRKPDAKSQSMAAQHRVKKSDRLRLVDIKANHHD